MEPVRSHRNKRVVDAARLHHARERRSSGRTIIEGPNLLDEALAAGVEPEAVFALPDDSRSAGLAEVHGFELIRVDPVALGRVAGTRTPRGPAAVIAVPSVPAPAGRGLLVAWGVGDPGNVGALVRTAAAFAWDFGFTPGTADPWSPKVVRAGAGGHFRIGIHPIESLRSLGDSGYTTVATTITGGLAPADLGPGRYAVLVGEESSGLPAEVLGHSALTVTIPMPGGVESLNAAMAAGMIVYELSKPGREGSGRV
jgi:TrmH family RNA methyltransferase